MTPEECAVLLEPLGLEHLHVMPHEAHDLAIWASGWKPEREEGWTFAMIEAVAKVLGVADIDLVAVHQWDEGQRMERYGGGCPSCGYGDTLVVRGVR